MPVPICFLFRTGSRYKNIINSAHRENRPYRHTGETSPDRMKCGYQNKQQEKAALNAPKSSKVLSRVPGPQAPCAAASAPPGATSVPVPPSPLGARAVPRKTGRIQLLCPSSLAVSPKSLTKSTSPAKSVSPLQGSHQTRVTLHRLLFRLVATYHSLASRLFFKL